MQNGSQVSAASDNGSSPSGIVLLTAGGPLAWIVINGLARRLGRLTVIEESPEPKWHVIRRRARRLGWPQALGQVGFGLLQRLQARLSQDRRARIWREHGLDPRVDPAITVHKVASVNADDSIALLQQLQPAVVAVYGTRIIKLSTLQAVAAPFINSHAGVNPPYRGQHPAYWALSCGEASLAGVTIHLVDTGVDTGAVLRQATVDFGPNDNISTYQHRQAATALPLFAAAIEDALAGHLSSRQVELPSKLWFPPTLWSYLATGLTRKVW